MTDVDKRCREITDQLLALHGMTFPDGPRYDTFAAYQDAIRRFYNDREDRVLALEEQLEALGD